MLFTVASARSTLVIAVEAFDADVTSMLVTELVVVTWVVPS